MTQLGAMSGTSKRAEQKQATRDRLIQVSFELFSQQGILATRTLEIATAAGVAHGTIFSHFATRDDLVTAVVSKSAGQIARRLNELVEQRATLREVLTSHLACLSEQEDFYARLVMEGPLLPSSVRRRVSDIQSTIAFSFAEAAESERAEGLIRFQRVDLLFDTWLGLVHHYICNRDLFSNGGEPVLIQRGPELLQHFLSLIAEEKT